ncbi:MAG TPA: divalent-cation tolerance protein CutA [Candidatus Omnitrophota bacterium]|nr:divalent-cation tolerance protein CutA [Candidatus Omnitrophota bacterium]
MHIVVLVTTKDTRQAQKIANGLLQDKLVACANIVAGVRSLFWWQGKIDSSKEALLVLKTKKILFKKVAAKVKALHSYEVPEIIALPIAAGSSDYLKWINASVN